MDVFLKHGIKLPNAVLVEGITELGGNEVIEFLDQYGLISRTETISEKESEFNGMLVVEFASGAALDVLRPTLPYTFVSAKKTYTCCILELSTVCTEHFAKAKTTSYLSDLQNLAKLTGVDYKEVLKTTMTQIGLSVPELHSAIHVKELPITESTAPPEPSVKKSIQSSSATDAVRSAPEPHNDPSDSMRPEFRQSTSSIDVNPPEVQRYVVEHIVKNEENAVYHQRLRVFSGRLPRPAHEADYDTWRSGVELLLKDPSVSDLHRSRRIVESLLPPAADMVKQLSSSTLPAVYLSTLDSAYATVQDGDELFAKFMDTFQDSGEKPSAYLQRLQVVLNSAMKRGGVIESEVNRHLLNQFCRGCWDNSLIAELQLKQKKTYPPTFSELLLLLRTEEDREAAKAFRMKQHLGSTRQKVTAHAQFARADPEDGRAVTSLINITQQLAQQLADVQRQLAMLTASQSKTSPISKTSSHSKLHARATNQQSHRPTNTPPKPGYCFRCGEDGHIRPQCENEPNPTLVARKKKQFTSNQKNTSNVVHLN